MRKALWLWLLPLAWLLAGWMAAPAAALPANPWTGQWLIPLSQIPCNTNAALGITRDVIFTATQTGNRVTFTYRLPGGQSGQIVGTTSADNTTLTAGNAPDGWTETPQYCFGTGHGSINLSMAADARSFVTSSGSTDFGNSVNITGTYQGGGTEPRTTPPPTITTQPPNITRTICPGGPWSGQWQTPRGRIFTIRQNGNTYTETGSTGGEQGQATIAGSTATGTYTLTTDSGTGTFTSVLAPDGLSFTSSGTTTSGRPDNPFTAQFIGCGTATPTPTTPLLPPAPNLQNTIPSPQTLTNGPTTLVAPGVISLRSLRRSKCVLVKVATTRPARILVSIFSGRRSIRLFGQKLEVFFVPGRRQPCIPVPFRAHTFNVRTPLNVALGYTAGSQRQVGGRKPRPVIKPIRLTP
jgi:hypothetical protein